jgi:hypothetical protein
MIVVEHSRCPLRHQPRSTSGSCYHTFGNRSWCPFDATAMSTEYFCSGAFYFRTRGANMKIVKICAVGAFLCCGGTFTFAQEDSTPAAQAAESVNFDGGLDELIPAPASDLNRNPELADDHTIVDGGENPFYTSSPSDQKATVSAAPDTSDPASLSVSTQHHEVGPVVGLMNYPDASESPVAWPNYGRYNPTARVMMKSWCVDGLWSSFPAERAAQCAKIQQHLSGNCSAGCGGHTLGGCQVGQQGCGQVRNRYTHTGSSACDSNPTPCTSCQAAKSFGPINVTSKMVPMVPKEPVDEQTNVAGRPVVIR